MLGFQDTVCQNKGMLPRILIYAGMVHFPYLRCFLVTFLKINTSLKFSIKKRLCFFFSYEYCFNTSKIIDSKI